MTPFQLYCQKWKDGCGSELCQGAFRIAHCRGSLPCDIAFVGEAPGESEDTDGLPFVGPAGQLMDQIIHRAIPREDSVNEDYESETYPMYTHALMNLVGCIPRDEDGNKSGEPDHDSVIQCRPRLEELLRIASPRLVVAVGKQPAKYLEQGFKYSVKVPNGAKIVNVVHPAYILRQKTSSRSLLVNQSVVIIQSAIRLMENAHAPG